MRRFTMCAVLLLTASMALAGERGGRANAQRMRDLNLTDAQKAQISQLESQFRDANQAAFQAARAASKEYREAKRTGNTAKAAALRPQVEARRDELKKMREAQQAQIRGLLTPEQQAKYDQRRTRNRRRG